MAFTLPAPTTWGQVAQSQPAWKNFVALAAAINGIPGTPTGTGFLHITGGVVDPAALSITKSIQPGTITIGAGASSNTFTLGTAVTVANAFVAFGGFTTSAAGNFLDTCTVVLTNSTTVT